MTVPVYDFGGAEPRIAHSARVACGSYMTERSSGRGPQFVRYFGPVLDALRELGGSGRPAEVEALVISALGLSDDVQNETTKSGQSRFRNQVAWAKFYLVKAGLVVSSARGVWSLTDKGQHTILSPKAALDLFKNVHTQFSHEEGSVAPSITEDPAPSPPPDDVKTFTSYREDLLAILKSLPPSGFEKICQRLLRESGFEQVTITGRSGDGGIDGHGVLQVNPFVSFRVLFQSKRYDSTAITPSQVRDFRGAMAGRTDKGIILTTGTFTTEARKEAIRDGVPPIELVDGEKLIEMFEHLQLGLKPVQTYEFDQGFFDDFR